jgi:hypothetical protein
VAAEDDDDALTTLTREGHLLPFASPSNVCYDDICEKEAHARAVLSVDIQGPHHVLEGGAMRTGRRLVVGLLSAVALLGSEALALQPWGTAHAAGSRLFFSEYVEGSGNNQALEIYNGTGKSIDLASGGYNVQIYFDGSATPGRTINLTGTVADGGVYVIANSSAAAAIVARANQTDSGTWFDGNDAVALRKGTVRLDVIGQIGFNPGSEWGWGGTTTADATLRRNYCEGDANGANAFDPVGWWQAYPADTFDGLGAHTADCPSLPIPLPLLYGIGAVMLIGLGIVVPRLASRKGVKLGILGTFLRWLAIYVVLMPVAEFIAARGDARTMALAATAELAVIALLAGLMVGWSQPDRTTGALQWIGVIIVSYVPVAMSFGDSGVHLDELAGFSPYGAIALSLVLYEAAFFATHLLRRRWRR